MSELKATDDIQKYTYGGHGSHWVGCEETHWDCKIRSLQSALTTLRQNLKEAGVDLTHFAKRYSGHNGDIEWAAEKCLDILRAHHLIEEEKPVMKKESDLDRAARRCGDFDNTFYEEE